MNIALISAGYPPYKYGGIDVQSYDLAHALADEKVNVTVYCGYSKNPVNTVENEYLNVTRLPFRDIIPRNLWFQLQNKSLFKDQLSKFDLVHTQHSSGSIYGLLKNRVGKPWVVSFHDHEVRRLLMLFNSKPWTQSPGDVAFYAVGFPIFSVFTKTELNNADHYIACGLTGYKDYVDFSNIDNSKTTLIPNSIHLDKIQKAAKAYEETDQPVEKKDLTIFTCGRLFTSKGIQYLIMAMPEVLKQNPKVHLNIFGQGPLRPQLEKLIRTLGIENNVKLQGYASYERLMYELQQSDLTVFPSLIEVGASLAIMEAMASHKTVIAFKYPFILEVIEHQKTGYLVPPKDVKALARAINLLLSDKQLRNKIGDNAHQKIVKDHNWKNNVKKYIQVYSQMINTKR
ncbi:MAG: glycosyltransferase family 4 protein [Candidatus Bathyarchaeia archaeon]|jgi:glycosyltransferase involved in cell wall biosynthesis